MRARPLVLRLQLSCQPPSGYRRPLCGGLLPLDTLLPPVALVEGVFDLVYLAYEVGDLHQFRRGVAARDDDVLEAGTVLENLYDLFLIHPAELHRVGELVEEQHVVGFVCQTALDLLPALAGEVGGVLQVLYGPRPSVALFEPVDVAEGLGGLLFADVPLTALDKLVDPYAIPARPAPQHDPEGGRGLAFAVARVDDEQRPFPVRPPPQPLLPWFPRLPRLAHATLLLSTSSTSDSACSSSSRRHRAPIAIASSPAIPSRRYPSSVSTTNEAAPSERNLAAAVSGSGPDVALPSVSSTSKIG